MRLLSLHGLSHDAWDRYSGNGGWDYRILAPGYKYNLTDIAAAIGIHQLARAEDMRRAREAIADEFLERLGDVDELELPPIDENRIHSWHLFPIRLRLETLTIDRDSVHPRVGPGRACRCVGALAPPAPPSLLRGDVWLASGPICPSRRPCGRDWSACRSSRR